MAKDADRMTQTHSIDPAMAGLACIVFYLGALGYVLHRSARAKYARPVEEPTPPQGGRKLESMPARQSPDGFLRGGLPPAEGTLAECGTNPYHERDETL